MAQATKTFKIGESCKGGIITVQIKGKTIIVIGKDWDMSQGTRRSSNQTNAKEFTRGTILSTDENSRRKLSDFLQDLTTYYYSEQVIEWIESKTELAKSLNW